MVRRVFLAMGWSIAGVAVAASLVAGAFAVSGARLTEPAVPIRVSVPMLVPEGGAAGAVTEDPSTRESSTSATLRPDDSRSGSGPTGSSEPARESDLETRGAGDD
jgi:hypothetical protein